MGNGKRIAKIFCLATALLLVAGPQTLQARTRPDADKHAQKMEKKLARFKPGALVHLVFSNHAESTGTLIEMGEQEFSLSNVETNATEHHTYRDVLEVSKGHNEIGRGSGHFRHLGH